MYRHHLKGAQPGNDYHAKEKEATNNIEGKERIEAGKSFYQLSGCKDYNRTHGRVS